VSELEFRPTSGHLQIILGRRKWLLWTGCDIPPAGLGSDLQTIRKLCSLDTELEDLFDQLTQRQAGARDAAKQALDIRLRAER